jgi:hypothetical protein
MDVERLVRECVCVERESGSVLRKEGMMFELEEILCEGNETRGGIGPSFNTCYASP